MHIGRGGWLVHSGSADLFWTLSLRVLVVDGVVVMLKPLCERLL